MPTPLRWVGMEVVRLIHWLDHSAGLATASVRNSPAWFFVTSVGMVGVGLTILLFVSMIEQTSSRNSQSIAQGPPAAFSRAGLEKNNEWSAQDRWRIAHFFVPHKPVERPKDIQIDSRLVNSSPESVRSRGQMGLESAANRRSNTRGNDLDVRLDLSRPKKAQQGSRLIAGTVLDSSFDADQPSETRIRRRDLRLLVQASWEFGSDCNRYDYVSLPVRRPISVPIPEAEPEPEEKPEIPLLPARRAMPDLGFSMEMFRFFSPNANFPADSRLVRQSERSVFILDERWLRNELASLSSRDWQRSRSTGLIEIDNAIPYAGIGNFDPMLRVVGNSDEVDQTLPALTQVDFRLELITPQVAAGGHSSQSKLVIRNEGQDPIQRIEVQDRISELRTVVAASPDGVVEDVLDSVTGSHSRLLHREVQGLMPGNGDEFSLKWIPEGGRRQFHRARVIAHAAVFAVTNVNPRDPDQQMPSIPPEIPPEKRPALACDVQYLDRVYVGDDVEVEITVRNTGDTPLHDVQVRIAIPEQLSHPDGKTVIFDAGSLQVRGQNQTVLKMSALQVGDAVNSLEVAASEQVEARGNTRILVVERSKEPKTLPPLPETIRSNPKLIPIPANQLSPIKQQPNGECCCQRISMVATDIGHRIP